ncbi:MAG TPA: HAD family hydrolase [Crinalium sp.]
MVTICCNGVTFSNIQAVVFDKDGTLADSASFLRNLGLRRSRLIDAQIPGVQEPLLMAFGIDGNTLNPAGLMAIGTRWENEIAAAAYVAETGRDWPDALKLVRSAFVEADQVMQRKADHTPLVEGSLDVLRSLAETSTKLGILSSDSTVNVQEFVQRYQLEPFFTVQMGTDGQISKPNPILLQQICDALGIPPEHTLLIGDSQADIGLARAGNAAGCIACTFMGHHSSGLMEADAVINHFSQIKVES